MRVSQRAGKAAQLGAKVNSAAKLAGTAIKYRRQASIVLNYGLSGYHVGHGFATGNPWEIGSGVLGTGLNSAFAARMLKNASGARGLLARRSTRNSLVAPSGRRTAIREALSDNSGRLLTKAERAGVKHTIRRVEQLGYEVTGSVKYGANLGIDLTFRGVRQGTSRIALAEAKAGRGLGSLVVDALGIRQGSYRFFETRLQRGRRLDLLQELQSGNAELFGGFARSGRLYRFDPMVFFNNVNFRRTPGAATLVP